MPATDYDAALLVGGEWSGGLSYDAAFSTWHIWDGRCRAPDDGDRIGKIAAGIGARLRYALRYARDEVEAAGGNWAEWAAQEKYAGGLLRNAGKAALTGYLATMLAVSHESLSDQHAEWLNTPAGTTDMRTGLTKPHDPADMLTYCLPLAYDGSLAFRCPKFLDMVHLMAGRNEQVAEYVLRVLGYALLGDNREHLIVFLNGPTNSGKSQVIYIVRQLLGALATESPADLITFSRHGRNARVENSIRGCRLVSVAETSARMHIEEGQLKRLTGEPVIAIDQHYAKSRITTRVTWLIICTTNDMPSVGTMDPAVRERMAVVPCGPTIPAELRIKGYADQILREEAGAILATLVHYAGDYFRWGLPQPADVVLATETYCQAQNIAAMFAADVLRTGLSAEFMVAGSKLWKACQDWGRELPMPGRNTFYEMLGRLDGVTKAELASGMTVFRGVSWAEDVPSYWQ